MNEDVVDLKEALERVQEDKELLLELFDIFLDDCPKKMEAIRQAAAKNDINQLKDTAHSLKGASGNISAKKLYHSFLAIEQMAKTGELKDIHNLLAVIDQQLIALREYSQNLKKDFK